jgi:predicted CopG family antitoxin
MEKTTIQVSKETLERLRALKRYERESYEETINTLADEAEEEVLTDEEIEDIKLALENVRKGEVKPIEQVAKELGVSLT